MRPLNDNDLDRLSREAADQYDVDLNTSGWEAVEHRLNKELPLQEEKERRRFLFWLFLFVMVAGGGLLWSTVGHKPETLDVTGAPVEVTDKNRMQPMAGDVKTAPDGGKLAKDDEPSPGEQVTAASDGIQTDGSNKRGAASGEHFAGDASINKKSTVPATKKSIADGGRTSPSTTSTNQPAFTTTNQLTEKDKAITHKEAKRNSSRQHYKVVKPRSGVGDNDLADNPEADPYMANSGMNPASKRSTGKQGKGKKGTLVPLPQAKHADDNADHVAKQTQDGAGRDAVKDRSGSSINNTVTSANTSTAIIPADTSDIAGNDVTPPSPMVNKENNAPAIDSAKTTPAATAKKKDPQTKKERGFEAGILAGPDMTNVKFTHSDQPGYNLGLQVGYRFSSRWQVNTGLIYTKKFYTVSPKDYTMNTYWQGKDVTLVDGNCQMFEIPVNLRYDLSVKKNARWFASAGASTYLMTNQYYNYYYKENGQNKKAGWETGENANYAFSILNLSFGYERTLGKHLAVQAEPYFHLPMKAVGGGNLYLTTYGIYFSLKYKFR